jgi:homoserine dehydrogenase
MYLTEIFVRGNVIGDVMFYGSGAGKLPTASAVVADVVDATKHLGTNIMTIWSNKKLTLISIKKSSHRFFVRIGRDNEEIKTEVSKIFGQIQVVKAKDVTGEFAFITEPMTEAEYSEKAANLKDIVSMIRVRF